MKIIYAFLFLGLSCAQTLFAQSTAFTYQGRLSSGGQAITGGYDFQFALRNATNAPVSITNSFTNVLVSNGLFTVSLDFGRDAFRGADRWLEIFVRTNGVSAFVLLSPRQQITPSPYSLASLEADLQNSNYGVSSTIGGGTQNVVSNEYSTVGGGYLNRIGGTYATIGGGSDNMVTKDGGTVGGGSGNRVGALGGTVAGGFANIAFGDYSGVGAGLNNSATADFATVGGGKENRATGIGSFIGGGGTDGIFQSGNSALRGGAVVVGGVENHAEGLNASIGGGQSGTARGDYATIPGGYGNRAIGDYSFAAGQRAFAGHAGTFVWADSLGNFFSSTAENQFLVRASGGVGLGTTNPAAKLHLYSDDNPTTFRIQSTGTPGFGRVEFVSNPQGDQNEWRPAYIQSLDTGGFTGGLGFYVNGTGFENRFSANEVMRIVNGRVGIGTNNPQSTLHVGGTLTATMINPTSDRNAKENFAPVSAQEVLGKVAALPISRWNFKGDNAAHVGPMAQDFHAAFKVGTDDKHIATVDADGVALAAIQGLNQKLEEKNTRIAELERRLEKLERLFAEKPRQ